MDFRASICRRGPSASFRYSASLMFRSLFIDASATAPMMPKPDSIVVVMALPSTVGNTCSSQVGVGAVTGAAAATGAAGASAGAAGAGAAVVSGAVGVSCATAGAAHNAVAATAITRLDDVILIHNLLFFGLLL